MKIVEKNGSFNAPISVCCRTCDNILEFVTGDTQHFEVVSEGKRALLCELCQYIYKNLKDLKWEPWDGEVSLKIMRAAVMRWQRELTELTGYDSTNIDQDEYYAKGVSWNYNKIIIMKLRSALGFPTILSPQNVSDEEVCSRLRAKQTDPIGKFGGTQ